LISLRTQIAFDRCSQFPVVTVYDENGSKGGEACRTRTSNRCKPPRRIILDAAFALNLRLSMSRTKFDNCKN
jgi:hypothetical protein